MENASKALIISGGVLIAILLLTLFSYLFTQMSQETSEIYSSMDEHEIAEFNQPFLNYEGRGVDNENYLTTQDVVTLVNLAQNSEKNSKFRAKVTIKLGSNEITNNYLTMLNDDIKSSKKYKCSKVEIDSETLLVKTVTINEKTEGS